MWSLQVSLLSADRKECSSWFQLTGPATENAVSPNLVAVLGKSTVNSTVQTMTTWMDADCCYHTVDMLGLVPQQRTLVLDPVVDFQPVSA